MARKKKDEGEIILASNTVEGDIVLLEGGARAKVISVGAINHTVTRDVPVSVHTYELLDGDWAGAQFNASLLGNDEIVIEERLSEHRSWWQRLFG